MIVFDIHLLLGIHNGQVQNWAIVDYMYIYKFENS